MRLSPVHLVPLFAALTLAGCRDTVTVPDTDLTPEERALLASALFGQALGASLEIPLQTTSSAQGPEAAPVQFSTTVEATIPCQLSGQLASEASVSGTVDNETGAADVTFTVTQTHSACTVNASGGLEIQIDGDPGTTLDLDFTSDGSGGFEASGSLIGGTLYAIGDRSGGCDTNLFFSGSGSDAGGEFILSGTVCGANLTISFTID